LAAGEAAEVEVLKLSAQQVNFRGQACQAIKMSVNPTVFADRLIRTTYRCIGLTKNEAELG
jgi:hypothetical protein